jgi:hypothetical protein
MVFKKGERNSGLEKYWNERKAKIAAGEKLEKMNGRPAYPATVKAGVVSKEKASKDQTADKIYQLGGPASRMLRKAINLGLQDKIELGGLADEIYHELGNIGWDKKRLDRAYKLLQKCQNINIMELGVKAAIEVLDKNVPDKIPQKKEEGVKSADDIRESILGLFKRIGAGKSQGGRSVVGIRVETNSESGQRTTVEGAVSVTGTPSETETGKTDRFLRAGGEATGSVPPEPEVTQDPIRSEPDSENDNDNRR